jgi:hydroxymethylpyrimidine pyrophosphatase-like HAD family hydrolase
MKLAASDYDGTLFRHNQVTEEDLRAIHLWREAGNLFGLATGRDLNLSRVELESKKIEFDFIVCNTGGSVYRRDENGSLLAVQILEVPKWAAQKVLRHPATASSNYWVLCQGPTTWLVRQAADSWLTGLSLPLTPITWDEAEKLGGLQQISLEYKTPAEAAEAVEHLSRDFGGDMAVHRSGFNVDLTAKGSSKAEGIRLLLEATGWPVDEVLAIGDTENDLSMIRRFNGYAVSEATEEVKQAARGVYESPGAMLLDYM